MTYEEIGNRINELKKLKMLLEDMASSVTDEASKRALLEGAKYIGIRLDEYKTSHWIMSLLN